MKHFTIKNGRLAEATYIASPNFNQRPTKNNAPEISGIVIHNISLPPSQFGQNDKNGTHYVKAFFQNRLNPNDQSCFLGRQNCNDFTIGIELEGDDYTPFEECQYQTLALAIVAIYQEYPATYRHLMGHSDIAPARKTDPGQYFDWQKLRLLIDKLLKNTNPMD